MRLRANAPQQRWRKQSQRTIVIVTPGCANPKNCQIWRPPSMSKKIPVSLPQRPLQSPFSTLSSKGLPEGPANLSPSVVGRKPRIVLRREKSQRGGKTVIVVSQLPTHLSPLEIENILRAARKALGCGGSVQEREIEIQGDQAERIGRYFKELGYEVAGP
jgi:translation initiation factor 1